MLSWQTLSLCRAQGQYAATQLIFPSLGLNAICTAAVLLLSCTHLLISSVLNCSVIAQQAHKTTSSMGLLMFTYA